jgi:hypothetical protein
MKKPTSSIIEADSTGNSSESSRTISASERVLNGAILAAEIDRGFEEYLEIFDHFYADEIEATLEGLPEAVQGKAAVRSVLARFLAPLHVFAEIGGLGVSIQWSPIKGDRPDETHSAWVLGLRGVTGANCKITWCSRRRWQSGRVLSEHHYDHHQIGGPLTFSDLSLSEDGMPSDFPTGPAKSQ